MGQGRFLLSFDCEAKWGMADCLTEHHHEALTNEHLLGAYSQILGILEAWKVKATFAFMAVWQLQTLFTPNPFDFLVIHLPTRDVQQLRYFTVAIPPVHLCKPDYFMPERIFIPFFRLICHR